MKNCLYLIVFFLYGLPAISQNTAAKLKFADAEQAFNESRFNDCIILLDETEDILGNTAPNILYLRIMAESKVWQADSYSGYAQIEKLKKLCGIYMQKYDIQGLEAKYRDVYELSEKLPSKANYEEQHTKREKLHKIAKLSGQDMTFVSEGAFAHINAKKDTLCLTSIHNFYIGTHEVTVGEFEKFVQETTYKTTAEKKGVSYVMKPPFWDWEEYSWEEKKEVSWRTDVNGKEYKEDKDTHPVIHISYTDAMAYCFWLTEKYGGIWRLPTEAEWTYAALGGAKRNGLKYCGSDELREVAWFWGNSSRKTHPVSQKKPNDLGVYDLLGNVSEICNDWYTKEYRPMGRLDNPTGSAEGTKKVIKSGSWSNGESSMSIGMRSGIDRDYTSASTGFRVCLTVN